MAAEHAAAIGRERGNVKVSGFPRPVVAGSGHRTTSVPRIFISYRREDSNNIVGRIYDRLVMEFGKKNVFKDVDSIPLGSDFRQILGEAVNQCDVVIAVIGRGWLDATDRAGKKRLTAKNDFVRVEIEAALERSIPVIPVLVDGASVPTAEELPETMGDLSFRNGIPVRYDPDFHIDMDRLVNGLKRGKPPRVRAVARNVEKPKSPARNFGVAALLPILLAAGIVGASYVWSGGPVVEKPGKVDLDPSKNIPVLPKPGMTAGRPADSTPPPSATAAPIPPQPSPSLEISKAPAEDAEVKALFARMPVGGSKESINIGLWIASPITKSDLPILESLAESMRQAGARLTGGFFFGKSKVAGLDNRVIAVNDPRQLLDRPDVDVLIVHGLHRQNAVYPDVMQSLPAFSRTMMAITWSCEAGRDIFVILPPKELSAWKPEPAPGFMISDGRSAIETSMKFRRIACVGNREMGNSFGEFFEAVKSRNPGPSQISNILK